MDSLAKHRRLPQLIILIISTESIDLDIVSTTEIRGNDAHLMIFLLYSCDLDGALHIPVEWIVNLIVRAIF